MVGQRNANLTKPHTNTTDALKRFHNPTVLDVARTFGITKSRAMKGITEIRLMLTAVPSFEWLNGAEMGCSNIYRRGLSPKVINDVHELAKTCNIDIRDDKALATAIKKVAGLHAAARRKGQGDARKKETERKRHQKYACVVGKGEDAAIYGGPSATMLLLGAGAA